MKKIWSERIVIESTEEDIYLVLDGVRMAKRGKPGTPEEETWIYLNPGSPERRSTMRPAMANAKRITRTKSPKLTERATTKIMPHECAVEFTETDEFLVLDGVRVAMRGKPGTAQAGIWIPLVPGYEVFEGEGFSAIVIDQFQPPIH